MKYNAFISYSHSEDSDLAPSLENGLEKFAKPLFKKRALNIFRDANDLSASPDLWGKIEEGLNQSEFFIFLASRAAAQSKWCKKEVEHWKTYKSIENFLVVLTDGDLVWDESKADFDWSKTTAIPDNLSGALNNEPLYVDFRQGFTEDQLHLDNPKFKTNLVLLAATIHKKSVGDMVGEAALQHKRIKRIRNAVIGSLSVLLAISVFLTFYAFEKKTEADQQRLFAEYETKKALLANYISAIQSEVVQDPTKAFRVAEFAYNFAKKNELGKEEIVKQLLKVYYSGYDFYLEHDINSKSANLDSERFDLRPKERDCWEGIEVQNDSSQVLYTKDRGFALSLNDGKATLIRPELYRYCDYFFPSFREVKQFLTNRHPITRTYFANEGKQILTESKYIPWDPDEFRPMPNGYEQFYYHLYKTASTPYIEDLQNKMDAKGLKKQYYSPSDSTALDINWDLDDNYGNVSRPIPTFNKDSTLYLTNEGLFNKAHEQLISLNMPMDDLYSNYNYKFSEDGNFLIVNFQLIPPSPKLKRRWIFALHPELIIARFNNSAVSGNIATLNAEDKARFLIDHPQQE